MLKATIPAAVILMGVTSFAHAQYDGYNSYTNQMVRDNINLRRTAERYASNRKASRTRSTKRQLSATLKVPAIKGLSYDAARQKLIAAGWKPILHSQSYEKSPNIQGGNGRTFWKKGYHEITDSSGTGKAFCHFRFKDSAGRGLSVFTAGEEDTGGKYHALVDSYAIANKVRK